MYKRLLILNKKILLSFLFVLTIFVSACLPFKFINNILAVDYALEENRFYEEQWRLKKEKFIISSDNSPIANNDGIIIIHGNDNLGFTYVKAIDSVSGEVIWITFLNTTSAGVMITKDDYVFVAVGGLPTVIALNIQGEVLWNKTLLFAKSVSEMSFNDQQLTVYTGDQEFYILDPNGNFIQDRSFESGTVFFIIDHIKYHLDGNAFVAYDNEQKGNIWELEMNKGVDGSPILDGDMIIFLTRSGNKYIYAVNKYNGTLYWRKNHDVYSNLCVLNDVIYFVDYYNSLVAVDKYSGEEISRVKFNQPIDYSHSGFYLTADSKNNILVITLGRTDQILGLKVVDHNSN